MCWGLEGEGMFVVCDFMNILEFVCFPLAYGTLVFRRLVSRSSEKAKRERCVLLRYYEMPHRRMTTMMLASMHASTVLMEVPCHSLTHH
jgi:hypothetical protein